MPCGEKAQGSDFRCVPLQSSLLFAISCVPQLDGAVQVCPWPRFAARLGRWPPERTLSVWPDGAAASLRRLPRMTRRLAVAFVAAGRGRFSVR